MKSVCQTLSIKEPESVKMGNETAAMCAGTAGEAILLTILTSTNITDATKREKIQSTFSKFDVQSESFDADVKSHVLESIMHEASRFLLKVAEPSGKRARFGQRKRTASQSPSS